MKKLLQYFFLISIASLASGAMAAITTNGAIADGFPSVFFIEPAEAPTTDGITGGSEVTERLVPNARPMSLRIGQNYPNPFNPITQIEFSLPERSSVKLTVYNAVGNAVKILVDGVRESGVHQLTLDLSAYPGGIYFYRFETPTWSQTRRMMFSK